MEIERNFPMQMCFVGDGMIATGSDNGEVLVWDLAQAEVTQALTHNSDRKSPLIFAENPQQTPSGAILVQSVAVSSLSTTFSFST